MGKKQDIRSGNFMVVEGEKVKLSRRATEVEPFYSSDEECKELLRATIARMDERQNLLYASNRYAVLFIFQAMDAAGKDGMIRHVMSGLNPQGCMVYSFKAPSTAELDHDFLWRTYL